MWREHWATCMSVRSFACTAHSLPSPWKSVISDAPESCQVGAAWLYHLTWSLKTLLGNRLVFVSFVFMRPASKFWLETKRQTCRLSRPMPVMPCSKQVTINKWQSTLQCRLKRFSDDILNHGKDTEWTWKRTWFDMVSRIRQWIFLSVCRSVSLYSSYSVVSPFQDNDNITGSTWVKCK